MFNLKRYRKAEERFNKAFRECLRTHDLLQNSSSHLSKVVGAAGDKRKSSYKLMAIKSAIEEEVGACPVGEQESNLLSSVLKGISDQIKTSLGGV